MGNLIFKPASGGKLDLRNNGGTAKIEVNDGADIAVTTGSASDDDFKVNSTQLVVEGDTGNVGIGGVSGGAKLDVNGTCALGDGADISGGHVAIKSDGTGTDGAFMIANNNGDVLMKVLDNGTVTKPLQPAFQVRPSSSQLNPANNATVVFDSETFDNNLDFSSNTFTAPVTGKYHFDLGIRYSGGVDNTNYVYFGNSLVTSNRNYQWIFDPRVWDSNGTYIMINIGVLADMDANDTAHVTFFIDGTNQSDIEPQSWFSGYLVC